MYPQITVPSGFIYSPNLSPMGSPILVPVRRFGNPIVNSEINGNSTETFKSCEDSSIIDVEIGPKLDDISSIASKLGFKNDTIDLFGETEDSDIKIRKMRFKGIITMNAKKHSMITSSLEMLKPSILKMHISSGMPSHESVRVYNNLIQNNKRVALSGHRTYPIWLVKHVNRDDLIASTMIPSYEENIERCISEYMTIITSVTRESTNVDSTIRDSTEVESTTIGDSPVIATGPVVSSNFLVTRGWFSIDRLCSYILLKCDSSFKNQVVRLRGNCRLRLSLDVNKGLNSKALTVSIKVSKPLDISESSLLKCTTFEIVDKDSKIIYTY